MALHLLRLMFSLYFSFSLLSLIHDDRDKVGEVLMRRLKNLSFCCWIILCLLNRLILAMARRFYVIWVNFLVLQLCILILYDRSTLQILSTSYLLSFWIFSPSYIHDYVFSFWNQNLNSLFSIIYFGHSGCSWPSRDWLNAAYGLRFFREFLAFPWSFWYSTN